MQSWQLSVDVACGHGVGVHNGKFPDACAAELFGGIRAHAAHAHEQHVRPRQPRETLRAY